MLENVEIIKIYLDNGLIKRCVDCQFARMNESFKNQFKEDFYQDLILYMATYGKLAKIHKEGHMNAWLTRVILNNIYSNTSRFYHDYLKYPGKIQFDIDTYQQEEDYGGEED